MKIYDVNGRELAVLENKILQKGEYKYQWNAASFPSGIYFYKLTTENFSQTKKMILIK
ncbi:MAG: T9SS type A sorting domain-containing protein [Bacteroidetes bacterium]|nr:T9SS type A sorting domain-containing protein [Bacteroidota bacterium]